MTWLQDILPVQLRAKPKIQAAPFYTVFYAAGRLFLSPRLIEQARGPKAFQMIQENDDAEHSEDFLDFMSRVVEERFSEPGEFRLRDSKGKKFHVSPIELWEHTILRCYLILVGKKNGWPAMSNHRDVACFRVRLPGNRVSALEHVIGPVYIARRPQWAENAVTGYGCAIEASQDFPAIYFDSKNWLGGRAPVILGGARRVCFSPDAARRIIRKALEREVALWKGYATSSSDGDYRRVCQRYMQMAEQALDGMDVTLTAELL